MTVPAGDLGELSSITLQSDLSGNAPGWFLDAIDIRSAGYGEAKHATFQDWIDKSTPYVLPL